MYSLGDGSRTIAYSRIDYRVERADGKISGQWQPAVNKILADSLL